VKSIYVLILLLFLIHPGLNAQSVFCYDGIEKLSPETWAAAYDDEVIPNCYSRKSNQEIITKKTAPTSASGWIFELNVANDMTFFTDRYFSSGVNAKFYAPFMEKSVFNKIMLPHRKDALNYYALTLVHHLYTPVYYDTISHRTIDHPFAAYLLFGNRKESFSAIHREKVISELQFGVIGPLAGGRTFQNTLHEHISFADPVNGWDKQIGNDICLQYSALYEKGFADAGWFELNGAGGIKLGIPHTEAQAGLYGRIGYFDDYFRHIGINGKKDLQVWFFCSGNAMLVAYNAVLQGGIFNEQESDAIQSINHVVWHGSYGGTLIYKSIKLEIAQEVISPTFQTGLWHRWAYASLMVGF